MAEQTGQEQTYTTHQLEMYSMFEKVPGKERKYSQLLWCVAEHKPKITIFTGYDEDKGGVLSFTFQPLDFMTFMTMLERVADATGIAEMAMREMTDVRDDNNRMTGEMKQGRSELKFGRNEKGMIWLKIVSPGRPDVPFFFRGNRFMEIMIGDTPASEDVKSKITAKSTVTALRSIIPGMTAKIKTMTRTLPPRNGVTYKKDYTPKNPSMVATESFEDIL